MWIEAIGGTLLAVFLGWMICVEGSRSYRSEDLEEARYEEYA